MNCIGINTLNKYRTLLKMFKEDDYFSSEIFKNFLSSLAEFSDAILSAFIRV